MPKNKIILEDDKMCFACGVNNPSGLKLEFCLKSDPSRGAVPAKIETKFTPAKIYQGFTNVVHGGIISLILDEAMLNLLWKIGKPALTVKLDVDFKRPAKVGEELFFEAEIEKEEKRLIYAKAHAQTQDGTLIAQAKAKCFRIKNSL